MHVSPRSVIRLIKNDGAPLWADKLGKKCRVGYYSKNNGLSVVWIVDQYGKYVETTDAEDLYEWFEVVELSDVDIDYYGDNCAQIDPIANPADDWKWT